MRYGNPTTNRLFDLLDVNRRLMLRRAYRQFRKHLDQYHARLAVYALITGSRNTD